MAVGAAESGAIPWGISVWGVERLQGLELVSPPLSLIFCSFMQTRCSTLRSRNTNNTGERGKCKLRTCDGNVDGIMGRFENKTAGAQVIEQGAWRVFTNILM